MKELTPEEQPRWNSIINGVLRQFIEICREHSLTYFCCGGTAIGAVRHHAMIPWDDDIDVFMPRPDYDRFVELASRQLPDGLELVTPYSKQDYPLYFVKLCDSHTTLQEEEEVPCVVGLYIDIFPIDGAPDDIEQARAMERRFTKTKHKLEAVSSHVSFADYLLLLTQPKEWGRFVRKTVAFFCRHAYRQRLLRQMERICRQYDYDDSTLVAVYCGSYGPKEVFPKAWLAGQVMFPYEDMEVALPSGYDNYLRQYYGDYMQLPPEEKRVSHHLKAYYNLYERESDEAVRKKVRRH
jgi:lipopolysaccharide cholinephosphotransferase